MLQHIVEVEGGSIANQLEDAEGLVYCQQDLGVVRGIGEREHHVVRKLQKAPEKHGVVD